MIPSLHVFHSIYFFYDFFLLLYATFIFLVVFLPFINDLFSSESVLSWVSCNLFLISEILLPFSFVSFPSLNNSPFTSDFCPFLALDFELVSQWFLSSKVFLSAWKIHFSYLLLHECLLKGIFLSCDVGNFTS